MWSTTNLAGQNFKFCHYDVIMVKFCFRFCYCDVTNDKIWVLASQNCRPCQVIIICKNSFSMFSSKSVNHWSFVRFPIETLIISLLPQKSGLVGFPTGGKFGFPLSNFDKSWIPEIVLNWGTRWSYHTDHIWDSPKSEFFRWIWFRNHNLDLLCFVILKNSFVISLSVPSLKSIDQKMYKNHAVIF